MEKKKKEDKYYLPRDISWMYFNRRILQEAMKERVPIQERHQGEPAKMNTELIPKHNNPIGHSLPYP